MDEAVQSDSLSSVEATKTWAAEVENALAREVLDAIPTQFAVLDRAGTIIFANSSWERFATSDASGLEGISIGENYLDACLRSASRLDPDQILARKSSMDLDGRSIAALDAATAVAYIEAAIAGASPPPFEYPSHSPGDDRWFKARAIPLGGSRAIVCHTEITMRHEMELALRESEQRFRSLTEKSYDVVMLLDSNGMITLVTGSIEASLGYSVDELTGSNVFDIVHPDDVATALSLFGDVKAVPGATAEMVCRVRRSDGGWRWLEGAGRNLIRDPAVRAVVVNVRDVTERREADERVNQSERRYRQLAQQFPNGAVFLFDHDFRYLIAEGEWLSSIGCSRQNVEGKTLAEVTTPETRAMLEPLYRAALRGEPSVGKATLNSRTYVRRLAPVRDEEDRIVGGLVMTQDITDMERLQQELQQSEERFRRIFEDAPVGIAIVGLDRNLIQTNEALGKMLGYSPDELHQIGAAAVTHPDDLLIDRADAERVIAGEIPFYEVEKRFITRDGEMRRGHVSCTVLRGTEGQVTCMLCMVQDVTERHRARQQLEALNEGLERANLELEARVESRTADLRLAHQEMESFGYSVSHDLRAPLRSMHGFSQALSDDYGSLLDDRGKDYLERIRHASVQMGTLIDGLLKMAQLSTAPLRVRSVNLSTIAQSAIEELALTNPTRSVQCQIQPEMIVEGDPALLRAMIGNLMSNAWKYSSKSSAAVIEFGTMSDGSRTIYFVRDNGVGFDMRYANKLFGPFQRLHSNKEFEGTGIGLANVRRIVERHGGSIWADSKVSQGATFYFNFPDTLKSSDEDS